MTFEKALVGYFEGGQIGRLDVVLDLFGGERDDLLVPASVRGDDVEQLGIRKVVLLVVVALVLQVLNLFEVDGLGDGGVQDIER